MTLTLYGNTNISWYMSVKVFFTCLSVLYEKSAQQKEKKAILIDVS